MTQAKIILGRTGTAPTTIELDGVDVAPVCAAITLHSSPRDFTTLRLTLNIPHTIAGADVKVKIDPMTAIVLKAAGWLEPPE